jgi:hypothetical protein
MRVIAVKSKKPVKKLHFRAAASGEESEAQNKKKHFSRLAPHPSSDELFPLDFSH